MIDLDRLKEVNDVSGHAAGDRQLAAAAEALRLCVRSHDFAARIGGDEFGVLATRLTPSDTVGLVARIEAAFDAREVSASVGHAPYTIATGLIGACAAADEAMYLRKRARSRGTTTLESQG